MFSIVSSFVHMPSFVVNLSMCVSVCGGGGGGGGCARVCVILSAIWLLIFFWLSFVGGFSSLL